MNHKVYSSIFIANKLLKLAEEEKIHKDFTPMKILKLVFLCHSWMLGIYKRPLIKDKIKAWTYGPVIENLYYAIRHYGSNAVNYPIISQNIDSEQQELAEDEEGLIKTVYDKYKFLNALQLSTITHEKDSPWYITKKIYGNDVIQNDLIKEYYDKKYQEIS